VRIGAASRGDLLSDLVLREPRVIRVSPTRRSEARHLGSVVRALEAELLPGLPPDLAAEFASGFRELLVEAGSAVGSARERRRRRSVVLGLLSADSTLSGSRLAARGRIVPREIAGNASSAAVSGDLAGHSDRKGGKVRQLTPEPSLRSTSWLAAETLAAHHDHPIYPLSLARVGLRPADLPRWAPEHAPRFGLRWVSVPREQVASGGELPSWWPSPPAHSDRVAIPVHPAMTSRLLQASLGDISWQPLPTPEILVRPTLSMRTVIPETDPSVHLKVPLPMRTLGRLNLRLVSRASLADGAVLTSVLKTLIGRDQQFRESVLTADESTWLHADNHLAVLIRRWPEVPQARIVPIAGLTARGWDGRMLIETLARDYFGGDLDAFLDVYLRTLLTWQLTLWLRYGLVHEAHPQNVLIAVDRPKGVPRVRLLLRDLDSCLIDPEAAPENAGIGPRLTDQRLIAKDPADLAAMVVTTTLHQCVASVLIETAIGLDRPVAPLLARIRPLIEDIGQTHRGTRDAALLISGILKAERLPVKRTLTAATLLPKSRTGAADVNKFYGADAPTYLW
jgi:siderophore synthetase component